MNQDELFSACPALGGVVAENPTLENSLARLLVHGQGGVFERSLKDAPATTLRAFLEEARTIDFEWLHQHREALRQGEALPLCPEDVEPLETATVESVAQQHLNLAQLGVEALERGQVAGLVFAGGAGTRFFSEIHSLKGALAQPNEVLAGIELDPSDPKGVFPISPVVGWTFFDIFVGEALRASRQAGRLAPLLFMTSRTTHAATQHYFASRNLWGFPSEGITLFPQAHHPRLDSDGLLIVADGHGHLSWTGDGHGGVYRALLAPRPEGSLAERLRQHGVQHLVMGNVDNPVLRPYDPVRIGYHLREKALFTLSVARKLDPNEKVGVVMMLRTIAPGGAPGPRVEVVEYNVIPGALAEARDPATGRLRFDGGHICVNVLALAAIKSDLEPTLYTGKSVASVHGPVKGSSLETLNQHLTRQLPPERVRAFEVRRDEFFLPTKNPTGADSVLTTQTGLSALHAGRLRANGARLAPTALIDLHPCCGETPEELACLGLGANLRLEAGARLGLCVGENDPGEPVIFQGPVTLEEGASLIIESDRPYGEVRVCGDRSLTFDRSQASRISIGSGLRVARGVKVVIRIGARKLVQLPAGTVFSENQSITR